jgi:hypothetical protein
MQWIHILDHEIKPEDGGSKASEMLVSNNETTWRNNSENHDF